jgi:hypothetical protein
MIQPTVGVSGGVAFATGIFPTWGGTEALA